MKNMAYVPIEELLKHGDSIYKLVTLASRRALELAGGSAPLINTKTDLKKLTTIALEEIMQDKVKYQIPDRKKEEHKNK